MKIGVTQVQHILLGPKSSIDLARSQIAEAIGARDHNSITFTSGGTEALNWVIHVTCETSCHVVSSAIEHCAVSAPLKKLENRGQIAVDYVSPPVEKFHLLVDDVIEKIRPETRLVCIMMANNETGAIQPIEEIGREINQINQNRDEFEKIKFLVDASQAFGKIKVDVEVLQCDYLVIAGHKFYAPRIGALYHRNPKIEPFLLGGGQEKGKRSGTENTPMIVGLGLAAQLVHENLKLYSEAMKTSRDKLWELLSKIDGIRWLSAEPALPNTLLISIPGKQTGAEIIQKCGGKIFASTGAACHSEKSASAVLTASKIPLDVQSRVIRFSTGRGTTIEDIENAAKQILSIVQ